jgi:hypothetical protein
VQTNKSILAFISGLFSFLCIVGCESANIDPTDNTNNNTSDNSSDNNDDNDDGDDINPGFTTELQEFSITPDDFADGTDLTEIDTNVTLSVADTDNVPFDLFKVTTTTDGQNYAPTGDKCFAHDNIQFFNDIRRFRLDFTRKASEITIAFAGGTGAGSTEIGRLQVYDIDDNLLAEYVTQPMMAGEVEVMTITRDSADIVWAVAYVADGEGNFGRFDDLSYTAEVVVASESK